MSEDKRLELLSKLDKWLEDLCNMYLDTKAGKEDFLKFRKIIDGFIHDVTEYGADFGYCSRCGR